MCIRDSTIVHTGDTNTKIRFPSVDNVTVETGGSERFRVADAASTFQNKLIIDDGSNGHLFLNNTSSENILASGTTGFGAYKNLVINSAQHTFKISNTEKLKITSSGQVFIGEGITSSYDHVILRNTNGNLVSQIVNTNTGNATKAYFQLQTGTDRYVNLENDYTSQYFQLQGNNITTAYYTFDTQIFRNNAATERARIDSSGNLLVGGTSLGAADSFGVQPSGHFRHIGASGSTGDTLIGAIDGVSNGFQVNISGTNVQKYKFHNGSTQTLLIDSDGLKFMNDTAAANALDDYEIGTWNPTFLGDSSNPTQSYVTQNGLYVKVGNFVYCDFDLQCASSGISGGSGYLRLGGLPFAKDSSLQTYGMSSSFAFSTNLSTSHPTAAYGSAGTSTIYLMSPDKSNGIVYGNASHVTNSSRVLGGFSYRTHL